LTSALDGVDDQRHAPAALPLRKTRYPLYRRLGGPQGTFRNDSCWERRIIASIFENIEQAFWVKVKVKCTLVQALRLFIGRTAHRGNRGIALPFSDHGSGRSLSLGKTRYPLYRRLGGPQGRFGQVRKISTPPGFHPRTVQRVASRYTDYATRPTFCVD
jgi:hypothetical protein